MISLNLMTKIFVITVKLGKPATQTALVKETRMQPQHQQDKCEKQDL